MTMALYQQKKAKMKDRRDESDNDLGDYSTEEEEWYGSAGAKGKRSRKDAKADKNTKLRYTATCAYVGKLLFLVSSALLIAVAAMRFTIVDMQSMHEAIMNFYFMFFGVVLAMLQLNVKRIKREFRFLNYHWGKALFCLFIAFASMSNS